MSDTRQIVAVAAAAAALGVAVGALWSRKSCGGCCGPKAASSGKPCCAAAGSCKGATESKAAEDSTDDYKPNGPVARKIAAVTPYFPFKGIERFYDIGGFLKDPECFRLVVDVFVKRYGSSAHAIDAVFGFDARGFVLGPPIALALGKPFYMLRKKGKMPNMVTGKEYTKEYAGTDTLGMSRGAVKKGDRVLLIDDLVATGGTLIAGIELVKAAGGTVVECACVVEIAFLKARERFVREGHADVPIWALLDETLLTRDGLKDATIDTTGYTDDGEAH